MRKFIRSVSRLATAEDGNEALSQDKDKNQGSVYAHGQPDHVARLSTLASTGIAVTEPSPKTGAPSTGKKSVQAKETANKSYSVDEQPPKARTKCCNTAKWNMPFTIDAWRWGLQEAVTIALLMWPACIPKVDQLLFHGNSRWVVASAAPVIEGTVGGTTRRMIDRVLGTMTAGILVIITFTITIGVQSQRADNYVCLTFLYLMVASCGFIYNWLLFRFPSHPLIGTTAAVMTPVMVSGSVFTGAAVTTAGWRAITVTCGVIVSGLVTRYFLPKRARVDIILGLARIIDELAVALGPLIKLESGLVISEKFFVSQDSGQEGSEARGENQWWTASSSAVMEDGRVEIYSNVWNDFKNSIWSRLEKCGNLTNDQLVMVKAARTEFSLRKKHTFSQSEHTEALVNIRTLFYHATSLYFLIDTQIGSASPEFERDELTQEIEHWSKFGILEIAGGRRKSAVRPTSGQQDDNNTQPYIDVDDRIKSDVFPTLKWAQLYGPTIGAMVRHICTALRALAEGLRETNYPIHSQIAMKRAANAIALFHRQRTERQQATATFVEYAIEGRSSSNMPKDDPEFITKFERILGLSVYDYESLSSLGRAAFWDNYWLLRDRLSTTDTTIMTLFVAVRKAIESVEALIDARIQKLNRGEKLHDHMDVENVEVEKFAAAKTAGDVR